MKINEILARLTMVRALILGVFFTSMYYFFVYDSGDNLSRSITQTKTEINAQKKLLADMTAKVDHAHEYQRSAAEMGEALDKLLSYIPENFRMQDFMKTVSEEAKTAGLNILRVNEGSSDGRNEKHPDFEALEVSVDLEGTFAQAMTFLANLTKQKQIFIVDRFSLDRGNGPIVNNANGEQESPSLSFKAQIKAYRYVGGKKKS